MRKPRILWANTYCLLDTSSGASISARQMLIELCNNGFEVRILGATIFDSETGAKQVTQHAESYKNEKIITVKDSPLTHQLIVTKHTNSTQLTATEISNWHSAYWQSLDQFKPDLVFYYGGQAHNLLIGSEARLRRIPVAAYLVNPNYHSTRWCRDTDLIITDSHATAGFYKKRLGINVDAVGTFIADDKVFKGKHKRENLLFINPSQRKGGFLMILLAKMLLTHRPDITIEVVESRGAWDKTLQEFNKSFSHNIELPNVLVTPNTNDVKPIYGRARALIAPSLWWESGSRVLAEAMLNSIPAIVTNYGGSPEMIGNAGIVFSLPDACHEAPYNKVPNEENLLPLINKIIELYDNEALYQTYVEKASQVSKVTHNKKTNTARLISVMKPYLEKMAGDQDFEPLLANNHKHKE